MCEIMPGILEKEWSEIEKKLTLIKPFAKTVHIDLLDGKFASNTSFADPEPFKKYSQDFFFELHMMVEEPIRYLKPWADAGFKRFLGHVERMSDQVAFVSRAQEVGDVGLALDADTSIDVIKVPLVDLDSLLIMTVRAGFSGQSFLPDILEKVVKLSEQDVVPLTVDGGVNLDTIKKARQAGAARFVATSALFQDNPLQQYQNLTAACQAVGQL